VSSYKLAQLLKIHRNRLENFTCLLFFISAVVVAIHAQTWLLFTRRSGYSEARGDLYRASAMVSSNAELPTVPDIAGLSRYSAYCRGVPEEQPLVPDL